MKFEWDDEKNRTNKAKHGIDYCGTTSTELRFKRHIRLKIEVSC